MLFLLTALVVAAILGTTTADEEIQIPWINEVPTKTKIPFDEATQAVELKVKWGIANNGYYWSNINLNGNDDETKVGFGFSNPGYTYQDGPLSGNPLPPTWAVAPCIGSERRLPMPENFVFSEEEVIWTVWKDNGKLNVLYNGEDFLRDGYPGVSEEFDCENPTEFPDGKVQWEPYWVAELKSVTFMGWNANEQFDGYRFIPIPMDAEPENNDDIHGDDIHGDDNGSYSGTTLLSRSSVIVTALLMAAFF
jgi:hypothetical protein